MASIDVEMSGRYRRLLGLGPGATLDDLRRSYRREMRAAHPDRIGGDGERAREINAARAFLGAEIRSAERPDVRPAPAVTIHPPVHTVIRTPPRTTPMPARHRPVATRRSTRRPPRASVGTGLGCVAVVVLVYVVVLVIAIIGWVLTEIVPMIAGALAY